MSIQIDISDELTPALQQLLAGNATFLRRVSKSVGWWFQKETKKQVSTGAPNGEQYPERIPYRVRKDLGDGHAPTSWYGRMKQAIGYEYRNGAVDIGWTSSTASLYGKIQEKGETFRVTQFVRARWARSGHPLSPATKFLTVPARPVFEPMSRLMKPKITPYIESKLKTYLAGNVQYGKKNRRKYKVYR